jgi:hypothetical protein
LFCQIFPGQKIKRLWVKRKKDFGQTYPTLYPSSQFWWTNSHPELAVCRLILQTSKGVLSFQSVLFQSFQNPDAPLCSINKEKTLGKGTREEKRKDPKSKQKTTLQK